MQGEGSQEGAAPWKGCTSSIFTVSFGIFDSNWKSCLVSFKRYVWLYLKEMAYSTSGKPPRKGSAVATASLDCSIPAFPCDPALGPHGGQSVMCLHLWE